MRRGIIATLAIVLVAIVGVLAYAATRPDAFAVERTASIKAPPDKIFPLINDLHSFASWSPYENKDPAMKRTYAGPASGRGAIYEWDGNRNVGAGRLEITDAAAPSKVAIDLVMLRPFEARNKVEFTLAPQGDSTNVTWAMRGTHIFLSKVMCLFIDMDRMVGRDFETGLATLKAKAEQS